MLQFCCTPAYSAANDQAIGILNITEQQPKKIPFRTWRECIKKVWEVDPLECPKCGAEMKIVSFINDAPVIEKNPQTAAITAYRAPRQATTGKHL